MSKDWTIDFIENLGTAMEAGGIQWTDDTGTQITVKVSIQLLAMIRDNLPHLAEIGQDTFKQFLLMMAKGQDFDALVLIYSKLDNSALILQYKEDAVKLAEIAKRAQETRDFWIAFAKQAAIKIVFGALSVLIP